MDLADLAPALALGFFGSAHCITMCGGVVGLLSMAQGEGERGSARVLWIRMALYNLGRVASYCVVGAIAAGLTAGTQSLMPVRGLQVAMRGFSGLLMVGAGLYLYGVFEGFSKVEKIGLPFWKVLEPMARRLLPVRRAWQALILGALWGWLPCGLVYTAAILAMGSGGARQGALSMLAFGLGTAPALFALGSVADAMQRFRSRTLIRMLAGTLILIFGVSHLSGAVTQWGTLR